MQAEWPQEPRCPLKRTWGGWAAGSDRDQVGAGEARSQSPGERRQSGQSGQSLGAPLPGPGHLTLTLCLQPHVSAAPSRGPCLRSDLQGFSLLRLPRPFWNLLGRTLIEYDSQEFLCRYFWEEYNQRQSFSAKICHRAAKHRHLCMGTFDITLNVLFSTFQ